MLICCHCPTCTSILSSQNIVFATDDKVDLPLTQTCHHQHALHHTYALCGQRAHAWETKCAQPASSYSTRPAKMHRPTYHIRRLGAGRLQTRLRCRVRVNTLEDEKQRDVCRGDGRVDLHHGPKHPLVLQGPQRSLAPCDVSRTICRFDLQS